MAWKPMKGKTNAIQNNVPTPLPNMVGGIRMEAEEDEEEEEELPPEEENINWQRILAVSSLVFALILVGGAIYLHIKERQLEEPQLAYQKKSFVGIGIPVAIAIERKTPKMPYKTPAYRHPISYNNYYYNNNNNIITNGDNNNNSKDSGVCKEVVVNTSAVEVATNNNKLTIITSTILKIGSIATEKVAILQTV